MGNIIRDKEEYYIVTKGQFPRRDKALNVNQHHSFKILEKKTD